jgi:hypothetical protein
MKELLTICPRCESNACSEVSNDKLTVWNCFGCGFTSNSTLTEKNIETTEETLPELYKALRFKSVEGLHWYPMSVILDNKAMVFAEGKTIEDCIQAFDSLLQDMNPKPRSRMTDNEPAFDKTKFITLLDKHEIALTMNALNDHNALGIADSFIGKFKHTIAAMFLRFQIDMD